MLVKKIDRNIIIIIHLIIIQHSITPNQKLNYVQKILTLLLIKLNLQVIKKKKSNAEYQRQYRARKKELTSNKKKLFITIIYQLFLTLMNYQQTLIRLRLLIFL